MKSARTWFLCIASCLLALSAAGCAQGGEPSVKKAFEQTPPEVSEEYVEAGREVVLSPYYEMSDGTWQADGRTYRHRLVLTGRLRNAVRDTTYTLLSNIEEISFEQAWKASGLSSNTDDYFAPEDAVFVAIQ